MPHENISHEHIYFFEKQEIEVEDFDAQGLILDIGGGGEGVIGKLKGGAVIAIDPSKRELEEAPPGPLKIVMDARELKFLDETFSSATLFFTLMFISNEEHPLIFEEVFRVLAPGGSVLIWDVVLPECLDDSTDIAAFPLTIKLPGEVIETGYGSRWPSMCQDLNYYKEIAMEAGFEERTSWEKDRLLYLELQKP